MPKRFIDGEALWHSAKLGKLPVWAKAEYANWIPLALANGTFEADVRLIWSRVYTYNRAEMSEGDVREVLAAFVRVDLVRLWREQVSEKLWGFFPGIDKAGRLPARSTVQKDKIPCGAEPPRWVLEGPEWLRKHPQERSALATAGELPEVVGQLGLIGADDTSPRESLGRLGLASSIPDPSDTVFAGKILCVTEKDHAELKEQFPNLDLLTHYRRAEFAMQHAPRTVDNPIMYLRKCLDDEDRQRMPLTDEGGRARRQKRPFTVTKHGAIRYEHPPEEPTDESESVQ